MLGKQLVFCATTPENHDTVDVTLVDIEADKTMHGKIPTTDLINWLQAKAGLREFSKEPIRKVG